MTTKVQKPLEVQAAINLEDKGALIAMGKAGAKAAADNRFWKKLSQEGVLAEAADHSERNRIGWDDDYRP